MKDEGYKFKSKASLISDFNMGADYLKFLCNEVMTEVARRGVQARDNPRFRTVKEYYSIVRELFNQSEAVWSSGETDDVRKMLDDIKDKINFSTRELKDSIPNLIYKIEIIQRTIYNLIRKYNMLIPFSATADTKEEKIKMLKTAFGVQNERIDFDNEKQP
jgi:hypothetical protein